MRILLVDDKIVGAQGLQADIQRAQPGFEVTIADTAEAAEKAVRDAIVAREPFDVILVDRYLGAADGIDLMMLLRELDPITDAIIFTGLGDKAEGQRAIDAGACDYFSKPLDDGRLLAQLRRLERERHTRSERNLLEALNDISAKMQQAETVQEVARIAVTAAPRLGFERARLWRLDEKTSDEGEVLPESELVGLDEAGNEGLEQFRGFRQRLDQSPHIREALAASHAMFFTGRSGGTPRLDRHFGRRGFRPPVGEWVTVPLFAEKKTMGFLILDSADQERAVSLAQRTMVRLFGREVAGALARTQAQDDTRLVREIGHALAKQAASQNLDDLLDVLRDEIGRAMPTASFIVALLDDERQHLDFRRHYEEGKLQSRHWRRYPTCLCGQVIKRNEPLLLPQGGGAYRKEHGFPACGKPSSSWLGVPLRIEGKAVGSLVVQDYKSVFRFGRREEGLLLAIADQIVGVIWMAYRAEREAQGAAYSETHIALRNRLRWLAETNEYWFWHAVLTAVTHRDGLSFNRAALFWFDETNACMQGRMGIGYFRCDEARQAWEEDEKEDRSFKDYLSNPELAYLKSTPLQQGVAKWRLDIGDSSSLCAQVVAQRRRVIVSSDDLRGCLPDELLSPTDLPADARSFECALVPVKWEDRVLGLLVVDNSVDGEPLRPDDVNKLEKLLAEAAEVWLKAIETTQLQRLGESYQDVLALAWLMMGQATDRDLQTSLFELCRQSQALTGADCVTILPYRSLGTGDDRDVSAYVGLQQDKVFQEATRSSPRQRGVTFSILQSGTLVVPNVVESDLSFGGQRLVEHDFLKREQIKALIGVPMRHATSGEPLGVMYLDYRSLHEFTEQEVVRAQHIAGIGAAVISYKRVTELESHGREAAEAHERLRQRAMRAMSEIQSLALSPGIDETRVIMAVLQNTNDLFDRQVPVTLAILRWDTQGETTYRFRQDYEWSENETLLEATIADIYDGQAGAVIRSAYEDQKLSVLDTSANEFALVVRPEEQLIGCLLVRKPKRKGEFDTVEREIIERLAEAAGLALSNVRARALLGPVAKAVHAVVEPQEVEATLQAVVEATRKVAPDIDCVTLWYLDADQSDRLAAGPQWGVRREEHRRENASANRLVKEVMKSTEAIFAPDARAAYVLKDSEFILKEEIASTAIFPLRFGGKVNAFGALFLNYRTPHIFTTIEKALFPIFADVVATAIHDAQALEQAEHGIERLDAALNIVSAVGTELERDKVLQQVLKALEEHFGKVTPYVMLYDKDGEVLFVPEPLRVLIPEDSLLRKGELSLHLDDSDEGVVCELAHKSSDSGDILVEAFDDITTELHYKDFGIGTISLLCAGLASKENGVNKGRLWGVLAVSSPSKKAFDEQSKKLMHLAAQQVIIALDRTERAALAQRTATIAGAMAWAADIAHDINSDVGYIRNRAYWLREREENLTPQGIQWAKEIDARVKKLADATRVAQTQWNDKTVFSLEELLREKIEQWQESNAPNVKVAIEAQGPSEVKGRREQTWSAVRHLLQNAVEAMESMEPADQQITLRLLPSGASRLELHVEDVGPGVPDDVRRRIFQEPYSTKDREGSGYGLQFAHWLIESMKGGISLQKGAPGRSTLFVVRLPMANREEEDDKD